MKTKTSSFKNQILEAAYALYRRLPMLHGPYRAVRRVLARRWLRHSVRKGPRRIVIGANKKYQEGWIPTELYTLDIRERTEWQRYFEPDSIDALLAEHVWEHLSLDDGESAARLCRTYLKPGGHLRVAVPDGLFPDPAYIDFVRPGGSGPSAYDHEVLFTYRTLAEVFEKAGFEVDLLEYYDEEGEFHTSPWDPADGFVERSARGRDGRSFDGRPYTSIVLDARKPRE